jgi:ATP synthase protein I
MAQPQRGAWSGIGVGWSITATMAAGMLVWGGVGYLVDGVVGTQHVLMAIGVVLGALAGVYIVYLRYGRERGSDDRA